MLRLALGVLCLMAAASAPLAAPAVPSGRAPVFAPGAVEGMRPLTAEQRMERRFLQDAAALQRFNAEAAKLALARSQSAAVREIALQLRKQHETSQADLQYLLHVRGMALPMLGNDQARALKQLARANGRHFDRMFLQEVGVRAQVLELRSYERMAQAASDPQVRAWVQAQLPALRLRIALAERALPERTATAPGSR
jgi:predicted outer membrane protein